MNYAEELGLTPEQIRQSERRAEVDVWLWNRIGIIKIIFSLIKINNRQHNSDSLYLYNHSNIDKNIILELTHNFSRDRLQECLELREAEILYTKEDDVKLSIPKMILLITSWVLAFFALPQFPDGTMRSIVIVVAALSFGLYLLVEWVSINMFINIRFYELTKEILKKSI